MQKKDDFLIPGFTGAFSSGSTTAAMFFKEELNKVRGDFLAKKEETNASIANFYNKSVVESKSDDEKPQKELLKLVRRRQVINALEVLEPVDFFYISMTDMMHSLLLEDVILSVDHPSDTPELYSDLIDFVKTWCHKKSLDSKYLSNIRSALKDRDGEGDNKAVFFDYLNKLRAFRKALDKLYSKRPYQLFDIMQRVGNNLRKCGRPFGDNENFSNDQHFGYSFTASRCGT